MYFKNLTRILIPVIVLLNLISLKSFAQTPEWEWAKSISGQGEELGVDIRTTIDGGVTVIGVSTSDVIILDSTTISPESAFKLTYSSEGKLLNSQNKLFVSTKSVIDTDGNTYVTGYFWDDTISIGNTTLYHSNPSSFNYDLFVAKISKDGETIWAKSFGGDFNDEPTSIALDKNGSIILTGFFESDSLNFDSYTLSKTKVYRIDHFDSDLFLAKFDINGNVVWAKSTGGSDDDRSRKLQVTDNGDICVIGWFISDTISFSTTALINTFVHNRTCDAFILKYDQNGNELWGKSFGGNMADTPLDFFLDKHENIYIAGDYDSPYISIDSITLFNKGFDDSFIFKLNIDGDVIWGRSEGGSHVDYIKIIVSDENENIYVGGQYASPDLIIGKDTLQKINPEGAEEIFIAKYDKDGELIWVKSITGELDQSIDGMTIIAENQIYVLGSFSSKKINLDKFSLEKYPSAYRDMFVAKLSNRITTIEKFSANTESQITIFPNPTASQFHIANLEPGNWTITIYTLDGQSVFKKEITEASSTIDLSGKAKGVYVYQLLKDGEVFKSGKLVVE